MKLLIITGDFPPKLSGVGDYTDRLALSLKALGVDVSVLTSETSDTNRPYQVLAKVRNWTMKSSSSVVDIARNFDVVNIQYPGVSYGRSPMINLLPRQLQKQTGAKSVVTIHDARVMRWRWRLRTWPMLNSVNGILYVDPGDGDVIKSWLTFNSPVMSCIPIASNVMVAPCSNESRLQWRTELGLGKDEVAVAFFGIIYPHKGLDELLEAMEKLQAKGRSIRPVIIGDFDRAADWRTELEKRLTLPGVVWVRGATLPRVSECLHACDMAALPFHSGTSVNRSSMLATLAHGLPTISTRGHVTPIQIDKLFDLELVPPRNSKLLEAAIERLLDDPQRRQTMRVAAIASASRLSWPVVAQDQKSFFESLVVKAGSR